MKTSTLKIAIIGPESTGKTTLANQLAGYYGIAPVPEYARKYIDQLDRNYQEKDLLIIAKEQIAMEDAYLKESKNMMICDTNLWVIKIWSMVKFNRCDPWILQQTNERNYDLHLLCKPDIPWEFDPQREHPEDRTRLFNKYKSSLQEKNINYTIVSGNQDERFKIAVNAVKNLN